MKRVRQLGGLLPASWKSVSPVGSASVLLLLGISTAPGAREFLGRTGLDGQDGYVSILSVSSQDGERVASATILRWRVVRLL